METQIGPYEVESELGRGGMGVVYRARDPRLDRTVAIKALPPEVASDPARLERFEREARTLAPLNHPNLAGIHGVEEQDGARYLVLEFVEGESLADRLDRGPLPVDEAIEFGAQIAAGLEAAHEAGVVHRDLKPANIMLTPDGVAKVLDFGLARTDEGQSSSASPGGGPDAATLTGPVNRAPTAPGVVLGTAAYMSPEQARGRRVDKRTDIWSFGVVLYEMLVGASPFVGETASDSIGAVLHKSFDFDRLPPETPGQARRVLKRCLERDRNLRYRDIGDVRIELLAAPEQGSAESGRSSGPRPAVALVGWLAALAFACLATLALVRPSPDAASIHASVLMPDGVRVDRVAISPDGERLVFIGQAYGSDRADSSFRGLAYVRELAAGTSRPVEGISDPYFASFSPDGRWLLFACNSNGDGLADLQRLPADLSGPAALIGTIGPSARVSGVGWFAWTPDSDITYLDAGSMELVIVSAGTGAEIRRVPITGDEVDRTFGSFTGPFGDHWIAISDPVFTDKGYREDELLIDIRTGETTRVLLDGGHAVLVGDDRLLFVRGSRIFESRFDLKTLKPVGEIRPVHDGLVTIAIWADGDFTLSDTGVLAYRPGGVRGSKRSIVVLGSDLSETPWSDEQRAFENSISLSADGERVAVVVASANGLYEIWVADTERRRFRRLLSEPGHDFSDPLFTPDGEFVLASRDEPGTDDSGQIMIAPFDGDGEPRQVYEALGTTLVIPHRVSADGDWLLLSTRAPNGERRFLEVPIDGRGEPRELTGLHPTVSSLDYGPGGLPLLVYISSESGTPLLCIRRLEDGRLGPEIPVSNEDVFAFGWVGFGENTAELSYLRTDREVRTRTISIDGRIRIGPSRLVQQEATRTADVAFAPNVGGVAIKFGDDEGPVTHVDIVTNWLATLDDD